MGRFSHPGNHPRVRHLPLKARAGAIRRAGVVLPNIVAVLTWALTFGSLWVGITWLDLALEASDGFAALVGVGGFWLASVGSVVAGEAARRALVNRALDKMVGEPCPSCGYDMTGLGQVACPECGLPP